MHAVKLIKHVHYFSGLWKPLLRFYLENDKFYVIIHNICLNYTIILVENDDSNLRFEVIHSISRYIKDSVQRNVVNDQATSRALKLLYRVLSRCILLWDTDFLDTLSRKCHSIVEHAWLIANHSTRADTVKHSLCIYVLMKVFSSEATQDEFDSVSKLIHVLQSILIGKDKFLHQIVNVFEAVDKAQKRTTTSAAKFQDYHTYFLVRGLPYNYCPSPRIHRSVYRIFVFFSRSPYARHTSKIFHFCTQIVKNMCPVIPSSKIFVVITRRN